MRLRWIAVVLPLLTAACVRQTQGANAASPKAPPPAQAGQSVWERQIHNATDAGDGDYQLKVMRDKVAAESQNIPARVELANAYRERGYPDVALEICRLAAARFPESAELQLALVRSLRDMNRRNEAILGLEAFLQTHPQESPDFYSWLGILRDEQGQFAAAEPWHRKALEKGAAADSLHNNLGYNLLMQKKIPEATGEFREALRLNPKSQVAHNNLGLALAQQNDVGEAVANWQSASDPAVAHNNLAVVLIEKGNYSEARKELELALGYNKTLPAALRNLELVSRLDGSPALFHVKQGETGWDRWKSGFKKLFVGPLDDTRKETGKATAAPANGGNDEEPFDPIYQR